VCPRRSDPFYVVTYFIKWLTTSWTYNKDFLWSEQGVLEESEVLPYLCSFQLNMNFVQYKNILYVQEVMTQFMY